MAFRFCYGLVKISQHTLLGGKIQSNVWHLYFLQLLSFWTLDKKETGSRRSLREPPQIDKTSPAQYRGELRKTPP